MFEGDFKLVHHLAPPLFAKRNDKGELVKRPFGGWMRSAFGVLAKLKGLRGTAFDVFGRTEERRTERALIDTPRTTIIACVLQGNAAYWAHCGDSRLYMVRGEKLIARTRDHSYTELQETLSHVVPMGEKFNRNVLFTCLGSPGKPVVDTAGPLRMMPGDRVLLCSDGLWGALSDAAICEQMARQPLSDAMPELVEMALRSAGPKSDNVTVLAVEWEAAEDLDSVAGISTNQLGDDVFASTIQASLGTDASSDELDDAEIERSIREINEAIQRSSNKRR